MRVSVLRGIVFSLVFLAAGSVSATGPTRWFVVAEIERMHGDSFLLPLSDLAHIADARALVAQGPGGAVGSIVGARIRAGADGLNRDLRGEGQPLWSWHVSEFEGFADAAIELCDGWPGFIQQDVAGFIANTGGRVCFWGYTVVAELAQAPQFAIGEFLDGVWYNPATPGQGFFLDVLGAQRQLFVGWFTFAEASINQVGSPDQRWLTAQGPYAGARATLRATHTRGGAFNLPQPVSSEDVGSLELVFNDCNHGSASFALAGGQTGSIPIERVVPLEACAR